jgi:hypothetical protein
MVLLSSERGMIEVPDSMEFRQRLEVVVEATGVADREEDVVMEVCSTEWGNHLPTSSSYRTNNTCRLHSLEVALLQMVHS